MPNVSPANVTYTGSTGAGQVITAKLFTNVVDFEVDFVKNTIKIVSDSGRTITYLDYSVITVFTWVIAAGIPTLTIS